jgi:hypothetical protein
MHSIAPPPARLLLRPTRYAIVVAIVVWLPLTAHAQPPAASSALAKDLQADLQSLATLARSGGNPPALDGVMAQSRSDCNGRRRRQRPYSGSRSIRGFFESDWIGCIGRASR